MTRQVRIDAMTGEVVLPDRNVHVTKNPAYGGPDKVHFIVIPAASGRKFKVDFSPYLNGSPFATAEVMVPADPPQDVTGSEGTYKYDVWDLTDPGKPELKDDPNVIID